MASVIQKNLRVPPQDSAAEQSVLGAIMLDKNAIIKVADLLRPIDFYDPRHKKIYEAILELFSRGEPIDVLTVSAELKRNKKIKDTGGSDYLAELLNLVPTSAHVVHYANIVKEKSIRRELINISSEIGEHAFENESIEQVLDSTEQKIFKISQNSVKQKFTHVKEELPHAYERFEMLHQSGDTGIRGVPTKFTDLDNLLSGLQKSDLIILGARPSYGKTSFALDIARNAALSGHSVGIFSLEMSREQIVDRLIASQAQVPLWHLRTGRIKDDFEFAMIQQALDDLSKTQIFIEDSPSSNIFQMRSMARRLQIEHNLDLLVIDYLQLIQPTTSSDNVVQQITEISRGLKSLAREMNVPILALSQLSRGVEQREVKIPRLSDLRDSGSIEQDADVILFIHRKDRINSELSLSLAEQNIVDILVAKHRNGPIGSVSLRFDPEKVCFMNLEKHHIPEQS